jgi:hypothetical protein
MDGSVNLEHSGRSRINSIALGCRATGSLIGLLGTVVKELKIQTQK